MDQDATWYRGKPWRRRPCVRWGRSSAPKRGTAPSFEPQCPLWPNGWIDKMPLGTEVYLGPGHIVLDGDAAAPTKGAQQPPLFGPCLLWPWLPMSITAELLFLICRMRICGRFLSEVFHYNTTEDTLKAYYQQWGEVTHTIIMRDQNTQRYFCLAFHVEYRLYRVHCVSD